MYMTFLGHNERVHDMMKYCTTAFPPQDSNLSITGSSQTNDIRVIGVVVVLLLLGVALIGLDWEAKV